MKIRNKKGLTILETLIAIAIIGVVIGGTVVLMVNISNYGTSAETRGLAIQYAQEAIDVAKNVRDNRYCNFFSNAAYPINTYYRVTPNPATPGSAFNLVTIASPGWEARPGSAAEIAATAMRRRIRIEAVPGIAATEARRFTVEVDWLTKGNATTDVYRVVTDIYKWK